MKFITIKLWNPIFLTIQTCRIGEAQYKLTDLFAHQPLRVSGEGLKTLRPRTKKHPYTYQTSLDCVSVSQRTQFKECTSERLRVGMWVLSPCPPHSQLLHTAYFYCIATTKEENYSLLIPFANIFHIQNDYSNELCKTNLKLIIILVNVHYLDGKPTKKVSLQAMTCWNLLMGLFTILAPKFGNSLIRFSSSAVNRSPNYQDYVIHASLRLVHTSTLHLYCLRMDCLYAYSLHKNYERILKRLSPDDIVFNILNLDKIFYKHHLCLESLPTNGLMTESLYIFLMFTIPRKLLICKRHWR